MPRRTPILASAAALALGSLSALGLAACGEESGSTASEGLERPPLTVGSDVTVPTGATTTRARTTTTPADGGGATDVDPGGATDTGSDPVAPTPEPTDTGGGATDTGDTGTDEPEPSNPGGAAPDVDEFCEENQGAC